jgi:hypothetical protein
MKKSFVFCILCLMTIGLFGQGTKFGVFIDPQITWLSSDTRDVNRDGIIMGVNGGLAIDKYFQKNYAINTGIALGTQGGTLNFENESVIKAFDESDTLPAGTSVDYKLNYITIPLGLKMKSNEIGYFSYFAQVGLTNQLNLKARANSSDNSLEKSDISEEIGLFNIGWHFGGGIEYGISKDTALSFGIFYHNGFLDILSRDNLKAVSRAVSLRVGVMF